MLGKAWRRQQKVDGHMTSADRKLTENRKWS